jgi:hypothetical protein
MKKGYHKGQELTMAELGLSLKEHALPLSIHKDNWLPGDLECTLQLFQ